MSIWTPDFHRFFVIGKRSLRTCPCLMEKMDQEEFQKNTLIKQTRDTKLASKELFEDVKAKNKKTFKGLWKISLALPMYLEINNQAMSCEGACAHAHVQCAVARVRSHVCMRNPFWKVCGMCAPAALFWACDVRSHFCTLFGTNLPENATFCLKKMFLEHLFLL